MDILPDFHFRYHRMVEFADTDLAGIMHFSNFFRFVEATEHAFFRSLGARVHTANGAQHEGWPRLEVSCKFHQPARFEQTLEVCLHIDEVRTSSVRYSFWVFAADDAQRAPLASGACSIIHVEIDAKAHEIQKAPIPTELRRKLEHAMKSARDDTNSGSSVTPGEQGARGTTPEAR